jgi:methylamine dehydrogenase accessory protein MauD
MWLLSYVVLWLMVVGLVVLALAILRQLGLLYARAGGSLGALQTADGIPLGEAIPVGDLFDTNGVSRSLTPTTRQFKIVLMMSPSCEVCRRLIPAIPDFASSVKRDAEMLVVLTQPDSSGQLQSWGAGAPHVAVEPALTDLLGVPATPYAMVIDRDGRASSKGVVNDIIQIESVLNEASQREPFESALEEARRG